MKKLMLWVLATLALVLASAPAPAELINGIEVSGTVNGWEGMSPTVLDATLTIPLVPYQADGTFLCNASGSTAIPYPCTVGTGLALSSGVLSSTATAFAVGSPNSRTLAFSTAYQATTSSKPCHVTINLTSSATLTLTSGTTNTAIVVIGSTSGVSSGSGTTVATYSNSLTGSLAIGINVVTSASQPISFVLPAGWYFAVLQQTGTVTISSAFDQSMG